MFYTEILKELYTCYTKKDDLVEQRKVQMEQYQKMIHTILQQPCQQNIVEFYKLYEKYNYRYNLETLENPLKCERLEEMIHKKNQMIDKMKGYNICSDFEKIKILFD